MVGSVVPDLAHVLPRSALTDHTAISVLTFSLPVGLLSFLTLRWFVAPALVAVAPVPWRAALGREQARPARGDRVVLGVALGAALHVLVDAFTHVYGAPVRLLPGLFGAPLRLGPWGAVPLYTVLQYGGGLAGSAYLLHLFSKWERGARSRPPRLLDLGPLAGAAGVAVCVALVSAWRESRGLPLPDRHQVFVVHGAMTVMLTLVAEALALSAVVHAARRARRLR